MASPLEALIMGTQAGTAMRQQKNQSRLADLAAQAYGAPQELRQGLVQQAIGIDANGGFALGQNLQKTDDARNEQLVQMARVLTGAPAQFKDSIYQRMRPALAQMGMDPNALPPGYNEQVEQTARALVEAYSPEARTAQMATFKAMTEGLSAEDAAKAKRIALGLDPRAVTGAMKFDTFTGEDGRPRPQRNNPTTGNVEIFYAEMGQWVPLGQQASAQPAPMRQVEYATSDGQPIPQEDAAAFQAAIAANERGEQFNIPAGGQLPPRMDYQNGGFMPGVGRRAEDEAFATESAKQAAQLRALPTQEAIKTQAAIATEQGKAGVQTQADIAKDNRQKASAFAQFEAAMRGVTTGLSNTTTGPVSGRLPALTANQQIADGSIAAMAPILKQLFRTAGEGTFTDRDQALLMAMLPTRQDHPAARKAKIDNINAIVRAKLLQQQSPQAGAPRVLKFNPATGKIE